ncbi:TetR/AcrR family transcriptional regulator [Halomonas sp. LS-001]
MTLGRPLSHHPDTALAAAMQTFWQSGYHHASLKVLLSAMKVSRSTLYHSFGNKEALFLAALERYRQRQLAHLADMRAEASSPWAFIEQLLYSVAENAEGEQAALGCLIFNSATELGGEDSVPARAANESVEMITQFFCRVVEDAQQEGTIPADREPLGAARFIVQSISGLRLLLKTGISQAQARDVVTYMLKGLR